MGVAAGVILLFGCTEWGLSVGERGGHTQERTMGPKRITHIFIVSGNVFPKETQDICYTGLSGRN